jgi:hypothetical protein
MRAFIEKTQAAIKETGTQAMRLASTPSKPPSEPGGGGVAATPIDASAKAHRNKDLLRGLRSQNKKLKHLYTVLSKSKKNIENDLSMFRSFAHQVLPSIVSADKAVDESLDIGSLVAEYEKLSLTPSLSTQDSLSSVTSASSSTSRTTSSTDVDLLGLLTTEPIAPQPTQIEIELRKELAEVVATKEKILQKFREAVNRLRALQQKYNALTEKTNEGTETSNIDQPALLSKVSKYEDMLGQIKQKLEKEFARRTKLQDTVEKMDQELVVSENQRIEQHKRAEKAEKICSTTQNKNIELTLALENAQKTIVEAANGTEETKVLHEQILVLKKRFRETAQEAEQVPLLEKSVGNLEVTNTALAAENIALVNELAEIRALYEDSRIRFNEVSEQIKKNDNNDNKNSENKVETRVTEHPLKEQVKSLEIKNKKLLVKGKELYSTHSKLKNEHTQLEEKCIGAEGRVDELAAASIIMEEKWKNMQIQNTEILTNMKTQQKLAMATLKKEHHIEIQKQSKLVADATASASAEQQKESEALAKLHTQIQDLTTALTNAKSSMNSATQDAAAVRIELETTQQQLKDEQGAHSNTRELVATATASMNERSLKESESSEKVRSALQKLEEYKKEAESAQNIVEIEKTKLTKQFEQSKAKQQDFATKGKLLVKKLKESNELRAKLEKEYEDALQHASFAEEQSKTHAEKEKELNLLVDKYRTEIEELKLTMVNSTSLREANASVEMQLQQALARLDAAVAENSTLTANISEFEAKREQDQASFTTQAQKHQKLLEKLQKTRANMEKEHKQNMVQKTEEASKEHEMAVERLNIYWKNELDTAKAKAITELSSLQEQITRLTTTLAEIEALKKSLEVDKSRLEENKSSLEQLGETNQEEWRERMSALQSSVDEMRKASAATDKSTGKKQLLMQENIRSSAQKLTKAEGELRVSQERIERILQSNREKDTEHQERMGALQRSLEEMRHRAASINAEQGELDTIQAALESKEAALEDVKKADRRIITDLKREMTRVLRQNRSEKDEQIVIAEKALSRLRQEEDRVAQLEEKVVVLRSDLIAKTKEVEMAMLQIEQLSAIAGSAGAAMAEVSTSGTSGGILSWFTSAPTPTRSSQGGGRGMGVRHGTPARLTLSQRGSRSVVR